ASGGMTAAGGGGAGFPAPYIYQIPNSRVQQTTVAINAGSARAMRAPGHPQASLGMESIMDEMALALNMDPLELRIKNDPSEIRREQFRIAGERFGWKAKYRAPGSSPGPVKSGVGSGDTTTGEDSSESETDNKIK